MLERQFPVEGGLPLTTNTSIYYYSSEEARKQYGFLSGEARLEMAEVYREAFGGPPWFERFKCGGCGGFSSTEACCAGATMSEAYPVEELVQEYFPQMMAEFAPGVLTLARRFDFIKPMGGEVLGFTTGGFTTFGDLVDIKYGGNAEILDSICRTSGIEPDMKVFYDNETCIRAELQNKGIGRALSAKRIEVARYLQADLVCGRSVNAPWLGLKKRQFEQAGYNFTSYTPEGDTYAVNGVPRQFYLAQRIRTSAAD